MFEKYVSSIILTLANKYIKNVNASELKLSLWGAPPPPATINQSAPRRPESLAREYPWHQQHRVLDGRASALSRLLCPRAGGAVTLNNVELRTEVLRRTSWRRR